MKQPPSPLHSLLSEDMLQAFGRPGTVEMHTAPVLIPSIPDLLDIPAVADGPAAETAQARRASVAVGLAPLGVLLGFTAVVGGWAEPAIGLAVFAACTAWLVYEMYRYQRVVDTLADEARGV